MEDNMNKLEADAPATIKEVGIHLAYMRDDIRELTGLVKEMPNGFATKEELLHLAARVKILEDTKGSIWSRFGLPTVYSVISAVVLLLILSFLDRLK